MSALPFRLSFRFMTKFNNGFFSSTFTVSNPKRSYTRTAFPSTSLTCNHTSHPPTLGTNSPIASNIAFATLVSDDDNGVSGVRGWAVDEGAADKLWDATERLLAKA